MNCFGIVCCDTVADDFFLVFGEKLFNFEQVAGLRFGVALMHGIKYYQTKSIKT